MERYPLPLPPYKGLQCPTPCSIWGPCISLVYEGPCSVRVSDEAHLLKISGPLSALLALLRATLATFRLKLFSLGYEVLNLSIIE